MIGDSRQLALCKIPGINSTKASKQILVSTYVKLCHIWRQFTTSPEETYRKFCNDPVAIAMFGRHYAGVVAGLSVERTMMTHEVFGGPLASPSDTVRYYRGLSYNNRDQRFAMLQSPQNVDPGRAGDALSMWGEFLAKHPDRNSTNSMRSENEEWLRSCFAADINELLSTPEFIELEKTANNICSYSLHAKVACTIMQMISKNDSLQNLKAVENVNMRGRIENNIRRLHLFLAIITKLCDGNHLRFTTMLELVFHEIFLLIIEVNQINSAAPLVSFKQFTDAIASEFRATINGVNGFSDEAPRENYDVQCYGYLANSGMHAYAVSLRISEILQNVLVKICTTLSKAHYYETELYSPTEIVPGAQVVDDPTAANVFVINTSMMAFAGGGNFENFVFTGDSINDVVVKNQAMMESDGSRIIIADVTIVNEQIQFSDLVKKLIANGQLIIIFWRSGNKWFQLGIDKILCGQIILFTNSHHKAKLTDFDTAAEEDMKRVVDLQIGAAIQVAKSLIFAENRKNPFTQYQETAYANAKTLMDELKRNGASIDIYQNGPFIVFPQNGLMMLVLKMISPLVMYRDGFGFNSISFVNQRISLGSEPAIDILIFGRVLSKFISEFKSVCDQYNGLSASVDDVTKTLMVMAVISNLVKGLNQYFIKFRCTGNSACDLLMQILGNKDRFMQLVVNLYLVQIILYTSDYKNIVKDCVVFGDLSGDEMLKTSQIAEICKFLLRSNESNLYTVRYLENSSKWLTMLSRLRIQLKREMCNFADSQNNKETYYGLIRRVGIESSSSIIMTDLYGTIDYKDGTTYFGGVEDGQESGQGERLFARAIISKFIGYFKNGKPISGTFYLASGDMIYTEHIDVVKFLPEIDKPCRFILDPNKLHKSVLTVLEVEGDNCSKKDWLLNPFGETQEVTAKIFLNNVVYYYVGTVKCGGLKAYWLGNLGNMEMDFTNSIKMAAWLELNSGTIYDINNVEIGKVTNGCINTL